MHEPTFMAYELRLLWHTKPPLLWHMNRFYWGWGWSLIIVEMLLLRKIANTVLSQKLHLANSWAILPEKKKFLQGPRSIFGNLSHRASGPNGVCARNSTGSQLSRNNFTTRNCVSLPVTKREKKKRGRPGLGPTFWIICNLSPQWHKKFRDISKPMVW